MTGKSGLGMGGVAVNGRPAWRHDDDERPSLLDIDDWRPEADEALETASDEEEDERGVVDVDPPNGPTDPPDATDATLDDANAAPEIAVMEETSGGCEAGMVMPTTSMKLETAEGPPSLPNVRVHLGRSTLLLPHTLLSSLSAPPFSSLQRVVKPP